MRKDICRQIFTVPKVRFDEARSAEVAVFKVTRKELGTSNGAVRESGQTQTARFKNSIIEIGLRQIGVQKFAVGEMRIGCQHISRHDIVKQNMVKRRKGQFCLCQDRILNGGGAYLRFCEIDAGTVTAVEGAVFKRGFRSVQLPQGGILEVHELTGGLEENRILQDGSVQNHAKESGIP